MVVQQQPGSPAVAGEARILVVLDDHPLKAGTMISQGSYGLIPGRQSQLGHLTLTDGPAKYELGRMVHDRDELGLALPWA